MKNGPVIFLQVGIDFSSKVKYQTDRSTVLVNRYHQIFSLC